MLSPFFRWWWAAVTGVVSLAGFVLTPASGWNFSQVGVLILMVTISTLLFLSLSVITQGWSVFTDHYGALEVKTVQKDGATGDDYIFVMAGHLPLGIGTLVDVHRRLGDIEVPFALIEVISVNEKGHYQAKSINMVPAHLGDYNAGKFTASDMIAHPFVTRERLRGTSELA
jgi:predicted membrane metal-binding protein